MAAQGLWWWALAKRPKGATSSGRTEVHPSRQMPGRGSGEGPQGTPEDPRLQSPIRMNHTDITPKSGEALG